MRRFWYFDVSVWSVDRKPYHSRLCQNSVFTPYCKDWEPVYPPNIFKRLQFPWIPLRYLQTPLRLLPDTHQISPGNMKCQQTTTDAKKHCQTFSNSTCQFLGVFGSVCWRLLACHVPQRCHGVIRGMFGGVWGNLSWIHGNLRRTNVFRGYMGSQSLLYGVKTHLLLSFERHDFLSTDHNETSKYQNRRI